MDSGSANELPYQQEIARLKKELEVLKQVASQTTMTTAILHNIGNVLNSVSTSIDLVKELANKFKIENFDKAIVKLESMLGANVQQDVQSSALLIQYFKKVEEYLGQFQTSLKSEAGQLDKYVEHIKHIIHTQQDYSKNIVFTEQVDLNMLLDDAVILSGWGMSNHNIVLEKQYAMLPRCSIDKHKILQILTNLIANAKHSLIASKQNNKIIKLTTQIDDQLIKITVQDNGLGISSENMKKLFQHGFTTSQSGHGVGLHSAAQSAKEIGGDLQARSDGVDKGAAFTLHLPLKNLH